MADLQTSFRKFHDSIMLDEEIDTLREKREKVLQRLFENLERRNPATRHQGSFALGTGIKPLGESDIDIDIALEFEIDPSSINAVALKQEVYEAVRIHTQSVVIREPCVTIQYQRNGELIYHVDLAVYATHGGKTYLARGKPGAGVKDDRWEAADPKGLVEYFQSRPAGEKVREQRRRVIRYLKRWKDVVFSSEGDAAPRSVALAVCALQWFQPHESDLDALTKLAATMHQQGPHIEVCLPVVPHSGLFERMNPQQRANYHARLGELLEALRSAKAETDPKRAAEQLRKFLSDDFPVPKSTVPAAGAAAIGTSGASA